MASTTVIDIAILSVASFCGIVGISLTGFGMAIVYVFVWQIFNLFDFLLPRQEYSDDFKFAIFIQALALVSAQPFLLYNAKISNAKRSMLYFALPAVLVCTPLGQMTAEHVPADLVKAAGGILVTFIASLEILQKFVISPDKKKSSNHAKQAYTPDIETGKLMLDSTSIGAVQDYTDNSIDFFRRFSVSDDNIGEGAFSVIKCGYDKTLTRPVAVKIVNFDGIDDDGIAALKNEMAIIESLVHPNIVEYVAHLNDFKQTYIVTEKMEGGDLLSLIQNQSCLSEARTRALCMSVLNALCYVHSQGIGHRDLKPENFLLDSRSNQAIIKLADFGLSKKLPPSGHFKTKCGTLSYVSPEVLLSKPYDLSTDMWSLGVLVYVMLSGYQPFRGDSEATLQRAIIDGTFCFDDEYWSNISSQAKSFITLLLSLMPKKRPIAGDALKHEWFSLDIAKSANEDIRSKQLVFFMIGSQRSGSNWLRTMLDEREDLASPHPPHIMRDFMPILDKFGDLSDEKNFRILVDHVATFVESNLVTWYDKHERKIKFNRHAILDQALRSCSRLHRARVANSKSTSLPKGLYLLSIFDAIMEFYTEANSKVTWICKSMGMSKFHDLLLEYYGENRLRYIYLVRDPRDVAMSFMKTPVGDCHYYVIAKKWTDLQKYALDILDRYPNLVLKVHYEQLLKSKVEVLSNVYDFIGKRRFGGISKEASVLCFKPINECANGAKFGRQSSTSAHVSSQFENLTRGDSFLESQHQKWLQPQNKLAIKDLLMIESVTYDSMTTLGYESHLVEKSMDRLTFSEEDILEFNEQNAAAISQMYQDLEKTHPDDYSRRVGQADVLSRDAELLSDWDDHSNSNNEKDIPEHANFDSNRRIEGTQVFKISSKRVVRCATVSQKGYNPANTLKPNQDDILLSFFKGNDFNVHTFGVLDGHGPDGHLCSSFVVSNFERCMEKFLEHKTKSNDNDVSLYTQLTKRAVMNSHNELHEDITKELCIDTKRSGTTFVCVCFLSNNRCLLSNLGDSACMMGSLNSDDGKYMGTFLTKPHDLSDETEKLRIQRFGGIVMTSEERFGGKAEDDKSVQRIWHSDAELSPGVMFTRSIGDCLAHNVGVISRPDITELDIEPSHKFMILCSDGVTGVLSVQKCIDIVANFTDPLKAASALVEAALKQWVERDSDVDDITATVIFFDENAEKSLNECQEFTYRSSILTLVAGGCAGFLGGLCGIQGPPLILYFLHPPHPISFDKITQRATGACITGMIAIVRIVYYLVESLALGKESFFNRSDWFLYVCIVGSSLLGVAVGDQLFERMKNSQNTIRKILSVLLLISGVGLVLSSFT